MQGTANQRPVSTDCERALYIIDDAPEGGLKCWDEAETQRVCVTWRAMHAKCAQGWRRRILNGRPSMSCYGGCLHGLQTYDATAYGLVEGG